MSKNLNTEADVKAAFEKAFTQRKCNLVGEYRSCIRARRLLINMYKKYGGMSYGQFLGLVTWMFAMQEAIGELRADIPNELWNAWGWLRHRRGGQPDRDATIFLRADLLLLLQTPNPFMHLLSDALAIRLQTYKTKTEQQIHLKDCANWSLITAKRVWEKEIPTPTPKPTRDWWKREGRKWRLL